jgi:hypothetical protein
VTILAPVPVSQADEGAAADAQSVAVVAPQADVAGAVDSIVIAVAGADVAGALDSLTSSVAAPATDKAAAVDSMAVTATSASADTAGAADTMAITVGPATPDNAGATDTMAITAVAPSADIAGAREDMAITVTAPSADIAGVTDKLTVTSAPAVPDTAGATDAISVHAAAPSADVAGAREAMSFPVPITAPAADAAGATDSMAIVKGAGGTFVSPFPGGGGRYTLPPGYQGGPSGAGSVTPSALGNSWEIVVISGADYVTVLAVIPGSMLMNWQFVRQLDDIGSGTVTLSQDDPWWEEVTLPGGLPTSTLLDEECLWQVWKDGVCRFDFLGETITEQLTDPSEQRQVTVTGPGTIATLKWAMVAPQGFPDIILKMDGLLDSFDEVDVNGNPVIDTSIWTTVSPADQIYITPIANLYSYPGGVGYALGTLMPSGSLTMIASTGGAFLESTAWDFTDTLVSVQMTPVGAASTATDSGNPQPFGTGLDGSQITQMYVISNTAPAGSRYYVMIAIDGTSFYGQYSGPDGQFTTFFPAYDSQQHAYWMITEQAGSGGGPGTFYWWTSPDGQAWTLQWQRVHPWDATNTRLVFEAAYFSPDSTTQFAQITNLNSNVTTPSYQGAIYLGESLMGVWYDQFTAAQDRGTIPFVTSNVTEAADSYGRPWSDIQNVQATNGTDLYSFLQSAAAVVNADYVMDPGFQLRVGQPSPGEVGIGVDRSGYLVFRDGVDVMSRQRVRARDQITTLLGGENADGHEISAFSPSFAAEWGQRETWFQASAQVDPVSMAYASAAALGQNETEIVSWTFTLVPNLPGKTVFDNFDVGDWVGLERPDFSGVDTVRVVGIAVQVDATGAETHELTFLSYIQWLAEQLQYIADKLGGKFVNALGTSPVAPSKYGTGQVPTYFSPAATLNSLADVAGGSAGSTMANAPLVYNPGTGQYQHAGSTDPVTGTMVPVTVQTPTGSTSVSDTSVVVNTGNGTTVIGLQGDGTVTTVDSGGGAPATPDVPAAIGIVQGLQVTWDGLLGGVAPLANFQYVQVHVGTSAGFTPSVATLVGTLATAGTLSISGLTVSATYYVKLVALTTAGVASPPTTAVSVAVAGLPTTDLTGQLPASLLGASAGATALNPNPFFNGGDLTGWAVVNGTLSATASPPAGAPGHPQYAAVLTSTAANCLMTGSPAPFQVTPGEPYAMTAWVYNPSGSAVTVAAGFNWSGGTSTVSCAPTAWTPVTVVGTCPGGVTTADQVVGPVASGVTVYVTGAVAAGQVPGQLLAAGSVAANQIAANTITAGQIAANTITASQIAANTITAAQIAAATITATQIAANTITAAKLAAGIVVAGIVNATTITGATFVATGTAGEFLTYSGTPGSGNLIMTVSAAATTDAFGNTVPKGLTVGVTGSPQIALVPSAGGPGSAAELQFPIFPLSFFLSPPNIAASSPSSTGQLDVSGPALAATGFTDSVQTIYYSFQGGGSTPAHADHRYIDTSNLAWNMLTVGCYGTTQAASRIDGVHPGTGTSNSNPAVAEVWQFPTLINGWGGGGFGINTLRYRLLPMGAGWIEIEADIINASATGTSTCAVLGSGYIPSQDHNRPASWGQFSNPAPNAPWLFVDVAGNITVVGLQLSNIEVFFHVLIPMD